MARVIIKAEHITQKFTIGDEVVQPLRDCTFELLESSFNIIYGASGSGKSTLLNILSGLQHPTSGKVTFGDDDIYSLSNDRRAFFRATHMGIVYQTSFWVKSLTVLDNVAMSLHFLGYPREEALERAAFALEQVGLRDFANKSPILLSGGEQQRVAVARAFAASPLYIVADEPTGSLDSANSDRVMDLLRDAQQNDGRTIILVTHNMEYLPLADHLLHIEDGRIKELQHDSIKEATRSLFNDMKNRLDRYDQPQAKRKSGNKA